MGFFRTIFKIMTPKQPKLSNRLKESGNVFMMLFGGVAMVGVIGAATMTVMKGPVKTMSEVTKRTVAENNMIASGKLALIAAASQSNNGDCDGDMIVEPIPYDAAIAGFTGGGSLPAIIGTAKQDPWGTEFAYCVWDHGDAVPANIDGDCGTGPNKANYLAGGNTNSEFVLAVISAGPDGVWDTVCNAFVDANTDNIPDTPIGC